MSGHPRSTSPLDAPARVALALLVVTALAACSRGEDIPESVRRCDLGRDNDQQVAGHDLAASTRLSDGRVLFAFGDTFLGEAEGGTRDTDVLINSTGALLPAGSQICETELEYLTNDQGRVRTLLPPPEERGTAYWPIDIEVLDGQVWMLYRWVEPTGSGSLQLVVRGTGLAVADETDLRWRPVGDLLVEGPRPLPSSLSSDGDDLIALVCDGGGQDDGDRCRLHPLDVEAPAIGPARPEPELDLAAAEMTLDRVPVEGVERWRVSSMPDLACVLRVAILTEDGWETEPVLAPDVGGDRLCYAGRIQEPFSTAERLVVTWVDSDDPPDDADRYWPHVEIVDLDQD